MPKTTTPYAVDDAAATIRAVADAVIGIKAEIGQLRERIREERAKLKAIGIRSGDFNTVLRLYELEPEDRDDSIRGIVKCSAALKVPLQGELFEAA